MRIYVKFRFFLCFLFSECLLHHIFLQYGWLNADESCASNPSPQLSGIYNFIAWNLCLLCASLLIILKIHTGVQDKLFSFAWFNIVEYFKCCNLLGEFLAIKKIISIIRTFKVGNCYINFSFVIFIAFRTFDIL